MATLYSPIFDVEIMAFLDEGCIMIRAWDTSLLDCVMIARSAPPRSTPHRDARLASDKINFQINGSKTSGLY